MYVWEIELQYHWDHEKDGTWNTYDTVVYTVAARTYEVALAKAEKLALKIKYVDDEERGTGETWRVDQTSIISVKRGVELNA